MNNEYYIISLIVATILNVIGFLFLCNYYLRKIHNSIIDKFTYFQSLSILPLINNGIRKEGVDFENKTD